jgi:Lrp/AsnC family transcriptional regulator, leucine-responsive regulatory protein
MDKTDREVIRLLQTDGRMSHEQISKEIHLSRPAVHDRIRRLETAGVIRGYTVQVDWDALGLSLGTLLFVRTVGSSRPVALEILKLSSDDALVEECHRLAGTWCLMVLIRSASTAAFQRLLDELNAIPGVQSTMTMIALSKVEPDEGRALIPAEAPGTLASRRN